MYLLSAEVHTELTELIRLLQSSDKAIRTQAEGHLQSSWTQPRPEILLMGLAELTQAATDSSTRCFAPILFRQVAGKRRETEKDGSKFTFLDFSEDQAFAIRQKLLDTLISETDPVVRKRIGDAVAQLAKVYTEKDEPWNELLACLFQLSQSPDSKKRETAYRIFKEAPSAIEKQHEGTVITAFTTGFKDDDLSVRLSAIEAFANFFGYVPKKTRRKYYPLLPDILNVLPLAKQSGSEDLMKAFGYITDIAMVSSAMFKPQFYSLVVFCVSVIQDKDLEDDCRQLALELLTTFSDYAPEMCRNEPSYTDHMITQCLSLMTEIEDDEDWLESDNHEQDDNSLNHVAGEQVLDRLATNLKGETILAPTFNWLPRMMASVAWEDRHAALMAIAAISEGCRDLMIIELSQVLDLVIPALTDANPRVRWAGCQALGQMSTDFSPTMQKEFYKRVLEAVIPVLDSAEARVKAHAAAALVNFCENANKDILAPYLDGLLSNLFRLLQNEKRFVQEQALSTIATIADAAEDAFAKYYNTLMPLLVNVLDQTPDKETRLLRSKAMECATLIALAVGAEKLGPDAITLVELLTKIQNSITNADDPDDPQAQYLMHCWGRMCRVLGHNFTKFLPRVMPPLIKVAAAKCDPDLLENDEEIEQKQMDGWELVQIQDKMIAFNSSVADDKHMATELLVIYAQVLKGDFAAYAAEIMEKVALPGIVLFFIHDVRVVSAKLIPQLLNCCKKAYGFPSAHVASLWSTTVDKLLDVLKAERAVDMLAELYQCFYESVEVLGRDCLSKDHMSLFIDAAIKVLNEYKEREAQRDADAQEETGDDAEIEDEELQLAIEDDQTLLSDMNKAFHAIFKNHGTSFLASWERLLPVCENFLVSTDPSQRQWGLCILDDVLEFCGHESIRYASFMTQPFRDGCRDPLAPNCRQAATYGIGEAARCGGPAWAPFLAGSIQTLFQVTQIPNARDEDNKYATENACIAIAKILHFNSSQISDEQGVAGQWLETLPVTNDEEGAPHAYAYLSELINKQHPAVVPNAAKIFVHVAKALDEGTIKGELARQVVDSTKALLTSCGIDATPLLNEFTQESQQSIMRHFS